MNYRQLQQQAKTLRAQGLIAKNFKLNQKATILKAEIEKVTASTQAPQNQEMTQENFNTKLIQVYLEEKKYQEEEIGLLAITTSRIEELLREEGVDAETFENLFNKAHGVFKARENGKELIQLELEYQADGTYILVA